MMHSFLSIKKILASDHFTPVENLSEGEKRGTFISPHLPIGVFAPASQNELLEVFPKFFKHNIPYYVVSCSKNWGFGGKLPNKPGLVCIDLKQINKITNYNAIMGSIRVEPGVSFQQAYEFLKEKDSPFILSVIGGSPESSLLANAVCRGDGTGVYGNRFLYSYNYKILKPDGTVVFLGVKPNSKNMLSHQIEGPFEQGLYTQSDAGLVLEIDVALAHKPSHLSLTSFSFSQSGLQKFFLKIKKAKNDGITRSTFAIWNSHKAIAKIDVNSNDSKQGEAVSKAMRDQYCIDDWNGQIPIESSNEQVGAEQQKALKNFLLSESTITKAFFSQKKDDFAFLKDSPYYGVPVVENLVSAYWGVRDRKIEGHDLEQDGVGFIWKCFLSSLDNPHLSDDLEEIESMSLKHGFSPQIALLFVEDHVVNILFSLSFDRLNEDESRSANLLFETLSDLLVQNSYQLFRKSIID